MLLVACGGGGGSNNPNTGGTVVITDPPPPVQDSEPQESYDTYLESKAEASQFLRLAGLGATDQALDRITGTSAVDWVANQQSLPGNNYLSQLSASVSRDNANAPHVSQLIYQNMIGTDAELRSRTAYALSQIFVISDRNFYNEGYGLAVWIDMLERNAFGNYRDLLEDVTTSPLMGSYLTYLYNRKGDERTGRMPDENYAREVLQLFSIGLVELNMDGTQKLGSDGQPIETYNSEDIAGLARVFTGYTLAGTSHRWQDRYPNAWERPMMMHEDWHSPLEKSFLGTTISENTLGEETIARALDAIFEHPNVAPFISRQLIQRFTASAPEPAYVERVANAFETGYFTADKGTRFGTGERGDLGATIAAIVLDRDFHDLNSNTREGKVREPVLNFVQFARAFRTMPRPTLNTSWTRINDTSSISDGLAQSPLKSPSVFNFYRPGYIAPGTESGDAGLTAPELQIVNEGSVLGYLNFMYDFITTEANHWDPSVVPDFTDELVLADDPEALVDHLDLLLTSGELSNDNRSAIIETISALDIRDNNPGNTERDKLSRVRMAVMMIVSTAEYMTLN